MSRRDARPVQLQNHDRRRGSGARSAARAGAPLRVALDVVQSEPRAHRAGERQQVLPRRGRGGSHRCCSSERRSLHPAGASHEAIAVGRCASCGCAPGSTGPGARRGGPRGHVAGLDDGSGGDPARAPPTVMGSRGRPRHRVARPVNRSTQVPGHRRIAHVWAAGRPRCLRHPRGADARSACGPRGERRGPLPRERGCSSSRGGAAASPPPPGRGS